jgi:4-O-beta-D-mannosyl-D-glucose phosphorylase
MHVATTTIEKLLDYVVNTPADEYHSAGSTHTLQRIIDNNKDYIDAPRSQILGN